jgi:hypothetical protein
MHHLVTWVTYNRYRAVNTYAGSSFMGVAPGQVKFSVGAVVKIPPWPGFLGFRRRQQNFKKNFRNKSKTDFN